MKTFIYLLFALSFYACNSDNEKEKKSLSKIENSPFDGLNIPDSIKKDFNKYLILSLKKYFQIDEREDYIIDSINLTINNNQVIEKIYTVNRLSKAKKDLVNSNNPAKFLELGMIGNYNNLIFYNPRTNAFHTPMSFPSSPYLGLIVNQISLSNSDNIEISVIYRIRDAAFKNFYHLNQDNIELVFSSKLFDNLKKVNPQAYYIEINETSPYEKFKNINVYEANISKPKNDDDLNLFIPKLSKTNKLLNEFFYNQKEKKYYYKAKS